MTTSRPSDAALLAAADPDAFRELYARYAERVFGYFVRRSGDHDAAFDLTAETFAQAWIMRRRFRDEAAGSAAPWLFGIARNVLLMSVRRGRLERARDRAARRGRAARRAVRAGDGGAGGALGRRRRRAARRAARAQREAVRLRVVDELDYEEVAVALGTSPAAARVRVHRGLAAASLRGAGDDRPSRPARRRAAARPATDDVAPRRAPAPRAARSPAALAAPAIVVPGAALAANALITNEDVATSMPGGT